MTRKVKRYRLPRPGAADLIVYDTSASAALSLARLAGYTSVTRAFEEPLEDAPVVLQEAPITSVRRKTTGV